MSIEPILDCYHEPLLIIGVGKQILWCNTTARRVLGSRGAMRERAGRLVLGSASVDRQLDALLAELSSPSHIAQGGVRGLRIGRPGSARDWLSVIRPLPFATPGSAVAFFVQVVGRTRPRDMPLRALRDLFGLTAREQELAATLLRTRSLSEAALRLHISRETLRCHLKRVFRKCDVHSQDELLSLLQCVSRFGA